MDRAVLAERVLSLVTGRAKAASLVGDLLEMESTGGAASFWRSFGQIFFASLWVDCTARPLPMIGLASLAAVAQAILGTAISIFWMIVCGETNGFCDADKVTCPEWLCSLMREGFVFDGVLLAPFLAGSLVARWFTKRGLALGVYYLVVGPAMLFLIGLLSTVAVPHARGGMSFLQLLGCLGAFFAGVMCAQRRQSRPAAT